MVAALDAERVATLGILLVLALAILGIVIAGLARAIVVKVVALVVVLGLIAAVWSQRQALQDCVERVQDTLTEGASGAAACEFLGLDVDVKAP
jgi:predicted aspartyl protease